MSLRVKILDLPFEIRKKIVEDLTIEKEGKKIFGKKSFTPKASSEKIEVYEIIIEHSIVILPLAYALEVLPKEILSKIKPKSSSYPKQTAGISFSQQLRPEQEKVRAEAIQNLNVYSSTLISAYPGFGKTCTSLFIASKIGFKTLIVVNRLVLIKQWEEAVEKFCKNASSAVLKNDVKAELKDFNIINAINIQKFSPEFFKDIGFLIIDEAHLILSDVLSKGMALIFPRYVLGLSATPYRPDGLDKLFNFYFTEHRIERKMIKEHLVFKVETGFTPTVEYDSNGKVNWNSILNQQSLDETRNDMICDILVKHKDRKFLVLCKRVEQAQILISKLVEKQETVTSLIQSETEFDKDARILIGTNSKVGTGFDHPSLDALLLACDLEEYFIQYLGRVFRREDVVPIVFDLVDENPILKRHFSTRKKVYSESGGQVKKYVF